MMPDPGRGGLLASGERAGKDRARSPAASLLAFLEAFRLFSSLETADEDASLFGGSLLGNKPLLVATGLSVLTIVFATELGFLQRLLSTASLSPDQWAVCLVVPLSLIVAEEVRKLLRVRAGEEPAPAAVAPAIAAA